MKQKIDPQVSAYIASFPKDVQTLLKLMRKTIHEVAPDAVEGMSYGMPGYKLAGKPLVYFGGFKNHIGFYATPAANVAFKKELSAYKNAKGSVQFPLTAPMPLDLIRKMVLFKAKEITEIN